MKKLLVAITIVVGLSSCQYEFIEPDVIDTNDTISFAQQIIPIFDAKCTACHSVGGTAPNPDLSSASAYQSIQSNQLVNLSDPISSKIYYYPSPSSSSHSQGKYSNVEDQLVLLWIQQGALDN